MKTIFISILSGVEAKDILRTDVVHRLLRAGHRVVLFFKSKERIDFYKKEFEHPNLIFESVSHFSLSRGDKLFEFLKKYLTRTTTIFLHKKAVFVAEKNYLTYSASIILSFVLGWGCVRKVARFLDEKLVVNNSFRGFFDRYNPALVFLANLFDPMEIAIVRESKKRNIRTIGFINSWDKITSKGHVRILPHRLIVTNEIVKDEAQYYLGETEENILVSGVPYYDHYVGKPVLSRDEFFKKISADPKKDLLIFAPLGRAWGISDWDMIDLLYELIQKKVFLKDLELLIRFPPNDFVHEENIKKRPYLRCDVPGVRFQTSLGMDWDMDFSEIEHLRNTLHHCSILVGYSSSVSIDSAFWNKPVINIGFTVRSMPFNKDPITRYQTTHYSKALRSGGIRLVNSKEELIEWVNKYLEDPSRDAEGRARLVREQCYKADGKAGERIAEFLLQNLTF